MTYKLYLTDSAGTHELPALEVPLTRVKNEKMTTVEPLSGNVYDDFIATKRVWTHTWAYLTKIEYDALDVIYERMKTDWTYPQLTIDDESVSDLVVKFEFGAKNIIDDCGEVQDVTVSFRETRQIDSGSGVLLLDDSDSKLYVNNNEFMEL
jgi:hypothetical protein